VALSAARAGQELEEDEPPKELAPPPPVHSKSGTLGVRKTRTDTSGIGGSSASPARSPDQRGATSLSATT